MNFKKTLELLLNDFSKNDIRYGLIGGFALGLWGINRTTIDLDFLIHRDDIDKVDKIMKLYEYECFYRTENVSQYISSIKIFGEIDFIHSFRKISLKMLERAIEMKIFEGELKIKVLKPEDIIGLKIQAAVNDPQRALQEYFDIESLMNHFKTELNWEMIEEYFTLFDLKEKYIELKKKYYAE